MGTEPKALLSPDVPPAGLADPGIFPLRLVILVPGQGLEVLALAQWIAASVSPCQPDVLLLSVAQNWDEEPCPRLHLSDLIALTRKLPIRVESELIVGQQWTNAVCEVWQPGDLVVCHAGQTISMPGGTRYPLSVALSNRLGEPVLILDGLYREPLHCPRSYVMEVAGWGVALAIIATFGALQIWITQHVMGWASQILLILSVLAEIGLIWIWNQTW